MAVPKKYKGKLSMLGNSKIGNGGKLYSIVEIGEHTVRNVDVRDYLDNYLNRALDYPGEVELEILDMKDSPPALKAKKILKRFGIFLLAFLAVLAIMTKSSGGSVMGLFYLLLFLLLILGVPIGGYILFKVGLTKFLVGKEKKTDYFWLNAITLDGKRHEAESA